MKIQAVTPQEIDPRGGQVLSVRGVFPASVALRGFVVLPGGERLPCYSGEAGQSFDTYAQGFTWNIVAPALPDDLALPASLGLRAELADGSESADLPAALTAAPAVYDSQTYALRSLFPPAYATGPRDIAQQQTWQTLPGAALEPLLGSLGETLSRVGGAQLSWVAQDGEPNDTQLRLGGSANWPTAGRFELGGVVYDYTGRSGTTLTGVSYRSGGVTKAGLAALAPKGTQVTDASRTYAQLDALRNSTFIATAQGADLSTCGRNYGLERDPGVPDDATFARALQAIAYGPRGTLYGLRTALDVLLSPGNYTLSEDTLNSPCRVFITAKQDALQVGSTLGRSYLTGPRPVAATDPQTLQLPKPLYLFRCLSFPAVDDSQSLTSARPSGVWTYQGSDETATSAIVPDVPGLERCTFSGRSGIYWGPPGMDPDSELALSLILRTETASGQTGPTGFVMAAGDGKQALCLTCVVDSSGYRRLRFCAPDGTLLGTQALPLPSAFTEVRLIRHGRAGAEVGAGRRRLRVPSDAFCASSLQGVIFGTPANAASGAPQVSVRNVRLHLEPGRNFAAAQGDNAQTSGSDDAAVHLDAPLLRPAMLNKALTLWAGSATRWAPGQSSGPAGTNAGTYSLQSIDGPADAHLALWQRSDAVLASGAANQVSFADAVLRYPQDLGRKLVLTGSGNNAGTFYIASLIGPDGRVCSLPYVRNCASALLVKSSGSAANLSAQAGVGATLLPTLVADANMRWQVADAAELTVQTDHVDVRLPAPLPQQGTYSYVSDDNLSGTICKSTLPEAFLRDQGPPPVFATYPFYVNDSLNFVGQYLNALCAAGVRPVFSVAGR